MAKKAKGIPAEELLKDICTAERNVNLRTLRDVILLAIELGREGREGKKIGAMFIVSDSNETLKRSRPLILDPLENHPSEKKKISDENLRETVKELSQLDGAFIVSDDGIVISACRYINASAKGIDLPLGLGSRHIAAAFISKRTNAVAVVLSESSIVRIFDDGKIIAEIIPEIWLIKRHGINLGDSYSANIEELNVKSKRKK